MLSHTELLREYAALPAIPKSRLNHLNCTFREDSVWIALADICAVPRLICVVFRRGGPSQIGNSVVVAIAVPMSDLVMFRWRLPDECKEHKPMNRNMRSLAWCAIEPHQQVSDA